MNELGMLRREYRRRATRVVGYFLLLCSSVVSSQFPSPSVERQGSTFSLLWGVMFSLAALCCFVGSALQSWLGEYAGLPVLIGTFAVYGAALIARASSEDWAGITVGMSCLAFSLLFYARWKDVQDTYKIAKGLNE